MKQICQAIRSTLARERHGMPGRTAAGARGDLLQPLAWTWSTTAALVLLTIHYFGFSWVANAIMIAGALATFTIYSRAETRRRRLQPVPYLSRGCNTVWQLDREG